MTMTADGTARKTPAGLGALVISLALCFAVAGLGAFRMAAWVILKEAGSLDDDLGLQMWVLRQVALVRLQDLGMEVAEVERLLDLEPDLRDAWLAYLALAPATVIDDIRGRRDSR